jgi:hypothetical protein
LEKGHQIGKRGPVDDGGVDGTDALVDHQQAYGDRGALFGKGALKPGMERHTCALQRALEQFRATTVGLEAVRHNGDEAPVGFRTPNAAARWRAAVVGSSRPAALRAKGGFISTTLGRWVR